MSEKLRYSEDELKEFEIILLDKLEIANTELELYRSIISGKTNNGTAGTTGASFSLDNAADTSSKEELNALAARQTKYIQSLENALVRIKNGRYGICFKSGKLISKARLLAVPTTTQSIEEKMKQY